MSLLTVPRTMGVGFGLFALLLSCGDPIAQPDPAPAPAPQAEIDSRLGSLEGLAPAVAKAFGAHEDFAPMPAPAAGDWLAQHEVENQSVGNYHVEGHFPPEPKQKLYVVALGNAVTTEGPAIADLLAYTEAYFSTPVAKMDPIQVTDVRPKTRENSGRTQVYAPDVLDHLRSHQPNDAWGVFAITMEDLYPGDDWNYVFGLARPEHRVAVFSFARYDPRFEDPAATADPALMKRRAQKILAHEVGHMFGLAHCKYYRCAMNGTNHLQEFDGAPSHLCPVCLRKLHLAREFTPANRYATLRPLYLGHADDEVAFIDRRLSRLAAD